MNRPRLSKSGVEYLDYSWGIWSGCRNLQAGICSVKACWAKGIALHYPKLYPNGFEPHYYHEAIEAPMHLKKPSRISVGWVGEIIGYCDPRSIAREAIIRTIRECPQHTFLFLTKNPEKLIHWGKFPDNCWVGVSMTDGYSDMLVPFKDVKAKVKFISFEPLLKWASWANSDMIKKSLKDAGISWVIIGSQTKPYKPPKIEWVNEIVSACDKAGIPVFLKDNLNPMFAENKCELYKKYRDTMFTFRDFLPEGKTSWHIRQQIPT